jgi:protein-disulfide isomerase
MDKRFWGVLGVIAVIVVGAIIIQGNHKSGSSSGGNAQPTNHVEGNGSTGVKLVEYGDYECPVCEAYYPIVKQTQAQFNDQIYFQFRNLPLSQIHPNAFAGARAAEAAAIQGKFWQMHDALYDNQQTWANSSDPSPFFKQYAQQLGLNITKFESDLSSDHVNNVINADLAAFKNTGKEQATPTFFIDGKYIDYNKLLGKDNRPSADKFAEIINKEIETKTGKSVSPNPSSSASPGASPNKQ